MIRVFYANRLWGEYPKGISNVDWIDMPNESFIYSVIGRNWYHKDKVGDIKEEEIPLEIRALNLIMGP